MGIVAIDAPLEAIDFTVERSAWEPSDDERAAIDAFWRARTERDPALYDGAIVVCYGATIDARPPRIALRRGDYKTYAWARAEGRAVAGVHAVGTCALAYDDAEDAYVLVRRSSRVAFDRGATSGVGGVVAWDDAVHGDAAAFLRASMRAEIDEELAADAASLRYVGAYLDEATLKLELLFVVRARAPRLAGWENDALVRVPRGRLRELPPESLETSTRVHLAMRGAELDARDPFSGH